MAGLLAVVALATCLLVPAIASAQTSHRPPRPLYWGAWIGSQLTGVAPPQDMTAVTAFEGIVDKGLSLVGLAAPFAICSRLPCTFAPFPASQMGNVRSYGAIPVLSWASESTPWDPTSASQPDFQLSDVIAGRYDAYISKFAVEAREWGHPFFLRFDWEMNGNWFPWSEGVNGNRPGEYVAAWRHVHDIFTEVGATNATWVWCPFSDPSKSRFKSLRPVYPGNEYVDWTCMDGYNWGKTPVNPHPWRSFSQIFSRTYRYLTKKVAPTKPVLLGELATGTSGGHKALWIRDMFAQLPTKFPRVRGLLWFDGFDRGIDWPIETSPTATRAFATGIRKGIYKGNRYSGLAPGPILPPTAPPRRGG